MRKVWLTLVVLAIAAGAQNAPQKQQLLWQRLEQQIKDADRELDGVLAVAVTDLTSGQKLDHHADEVMPTASTIKIAVLAELYRQSQQGGAKLTDLYTVNAADMVPDSHIMEGLTPGITRVTLRDLATMMIAVSDNAATNVLIERVGMENVNRMLDSLGLHSTRLRRKMMDLRAAQEGRENVATPREIDTLLETIYRGKLLNPELTTDFFKMLSTPKNSVFTRVLPDSVRFADKPGELEGVRNDCGIVYATKRPFALCVMTTYDRRERDAEDVIGKIAVAAYNMFERLGRASDYGRVISPANSGTK